MSRPHQPVRSKRALEQQISQLRAGDHLCLIYETREEQLASVVPFIREGLARRERCLYIEDDGTRREVVAALGAAGVDVEREVQRGALRFLTKRETYLRWGTFSPARMIGLLRRSTARALAEGFAGLRVTGEMTAVIGRGHWQERLIEYEARLNAFFPGSAALAICQYHRSRFPADVLDGVLRTHPLVILGDRVCPNLHYEGPAARLGRGSEAKQVDRMFAQLRRAADAEQRLRGSEARLALHVQQTPVAVIEWDTEFRVREWNPAAERIFGHSAAEARGQHARFIVPEPAREQVDRVWNALLVQRGGERSTNENVTKEGRTILCEWYNTALVDAGGQVVGVASLVQDVTESKRAERATRARLELAESAASRSLEEVLVATLDELEALTGSRIGFYHFLEADQRTLLLQAWSTRTERETCTAEGKGSHYDIDQAGVWADCVRERRPVVHNDYAALPHRKGMPPGHAPVTRELVVPIFRGDRIVAILGVGNKPTAYTTEDIELTSLFASLAWSTAEQKLAEREIQRLHRLYRVLSETNQMILRARTADEVLREACRIAVEVGSLRMAWAGVLNEATRLIVPVASFGEVGTYLDGIRISIDHIPEGLGPGGTALREGRPAVSQDIDRDPTMAPWRAAALAMGYRSGGSFPLRIGGVVKGLFVVYSAEVGSCTDEQVRLLSEMADDISFALEHLEQERRRAQAEEARRASEAEYRTLFERSSLGIYRSTPEGRFLAVNPALVEMLGYASAEEVLRLDLPRDVYADPAEGDRILRELPEQVETTWKRRAGTRFGVRLSVRSIPAPGGGVACFEGYAEDVSERRLLEEQLRQAQKMEAVGQLAGGVAHDFNNLLATILACSELVAEGFPADSPAHEDFESIRNAAQRGAELTRKLLAFSRQQTLELRTVALGTLVADFARMARRVVPEDVDLSLQVGAPDATTRADRGAVDQILMNLVTNARDAMPTGGKLLIAVDRSVLDEDHVKRFGWGDAGEYVTLTVSDTGCGMDEETQRRVFEPFYTTKPVGHGTGLGMPMVYGLVKQHQGFVHVTSEQGQGTTVRVYFPAVADETAARGPAAVAEVRGGSETILLVEDNEGLRRAAARVLEKHGYTVLQAADGQAALDLLAKRERPPHLIMSDVVMPRVSGPDLVRTLREAGSAPRVLFTSGYPARDIAERTQLGLDVAVLVKPWTGADLLGKVREVLDAPVAT